MSNVTFPQPEVEAPAYRTVYFYANLCGHIVEDSWGVHAVPGGTAPELEALAAGRIYLSREACQQRIAYDAQEMARLVKPLWMRKLGPDVEYQWAPGKWEAVTDFSGYDWSIVEPENYRAKPTEVVRIVDGVEYRWPATVTQGEPAGKRYTALLYRIKYKKHSCGFGNRTHHTRAGAEAQNAMISAVLGEFV